MDSKSSSMLLMTLACLPVSWRTPMASCITTRASMAATANSGESQPTVMPVATATAVTVAEWLEGMPPSPKRRSQVKRRLMMK